MGKSTVLRAALESLPHEGLAVCAMTGAASVLIGGCTLHRCGVCVALSFVFMCMVTWKIDRWAGVGLATGLPQEVLAHVEANSGKTLT